MVTPLYAAPELFRNELSDRSDQYSLAIVYQELLTGTRPIGGKNLRQLMMQHTMGEPNLDPLPEGDRAIIARALSKNPQDRFISCAGMVQALQAITGEDTAPLYSSQSLRPSDKRSGVRPRVGAAVRGRTPTETKRLTLCATKNLGPAEARALPDYHFIGYLARDPRGETSPFRRRGSWIGLPETPGCYRLSRG